MIKGENSQQSAGDKRLEHLKRKAAQAESEAMKKNIYKRGPFENLAKVGAEVRDIMVASNKQFKDVLAEAGIKDPYDVLLQSMAHWDKMLESSRLPSEEQLIKKLREDFQLNLVRAAQIFVPTDDLYPIKGKGDSEEAKEKGDDVNRVALALGTLLHMELDGKKILLDDIEVIVGRIPEHSWRTRPYWILNIKKQKIAVLVNNQHGNRTFVIGYKKKSELDELEGLTKEQLKELSEKNKLVHHFTYGDPAQFKGELAAAVQRVFEGKEMLRFYQTYEEASAAAKKLKIKSYLDYKDRHNEDPRLPSKPYKNYGDSFVGFADFLGTENISGAERKQELYPTYVEASAAAKKLRIMSKPDYEKKYMKDLRLPSNPDKKYGESFVGWADFLGTGNISKVDRGKHVYQTYADASAAAKKLGIKSKPDYQKRYKEDPRLPGDPYDKYGDNFKGFKDFLGTK